MFFTPLEQFKIFAPFSIYQTYLTNYSITVILILTLIVLMFSLLLYAPTLIPTGTQIILEQLYNFVLNLIKQQTGNDNRSLRFFIYFFTVFIIIVFANVLGLIPYSFTITSQFATTLFFAFSINFGLLIFGFIFNGIRFLKFFIPKGVPVALLPLIIAIEIFSYLIRTLSLSVRLFCNMTAGHTLLHMITSFAVLFLNSSHFIVLGFVSFLILAIYLLEFGIAFIQAYVFLILISIYLNDSIQAGH